MTSGASISSLVTVFVAFSLGLVAFSLAGRKSPLHGLSVTVAMNTVLLFPFPYLDNESARIYRVPIAYLPLIATWVALVLRLRRTLSRWEGSLLVLAGAVWVYQGLTAFWVEDYGSFIQYWVLWIVGFSGLILAAHEAKRLPHDQIDEILLGLAMVVTVGSGIGLLKHLLGWTVDANYMPIVNRNGTATVTVTALPVLLYLIDKRRIHRGWGFVALWVISIGLVLTFSRMGIVGGATGVILYLSLSRGGKRLLTSVLVASIAILLLIGGPWGTVLVDRLVRVPVVVQSLLSGGVPESGDQRRVELLREGWRIWSGHALVGTGVGLDNYTRYFEAPGTPAKPHMFYLSYLAELGLLGFPLMLGFIGWSTWLLVNSWWVTRRERGYPKLYATSAGLSIAVTSLVMFLMNEYATFPYLWFLWGLFIGYCRTSSTRVIAYRDPLCKKSASSPLEVEP